MAVTIRDAARVSIGSVMPAKSLELRHTIRLIRELDVEIADIETSIHSIMEQLHSFCRSAPGQGLLLVLPNGKEACRSRQAPPFHFR